MSKHSIPGRSRTLGSIGGRLRTPLLLQMEAAECGAACLGIVLAHYGRWVSLAELHDSCDVGRDGCTAEDIVKAADAYGLQVTGWRREVEQLGDLPLPAIIFWRFNHFVVLERISDGWYHINDPSFGHIRVDEDTFDRDFTGVVLVLQPTGEFKPGGTPPGILVRLWSWLHDFRRALAFAASCGLLLAVPGLALPFLLSVFVDDVLGAGQADWSGSLIWATAAAGILTYVLNLLQMRSLRKLAVHLSIRQSIRYMTRLFRMSAQFFSQRLAGDLASRMQLIDQVATVGSVQLVGIAIELVMSMAFLALMLALDVPLALAVAGLGLACVVLMRTVTRLRTDHNHRQRREQGLLLGYGMAGLRQIGTIRATASDNDFFARWSGRQARELNARQAFTELGHVTEAFPTLFLMLGLAIVCGVGGLRVMSGDMTVGTLLGFYLVATNFMHPVGRFVQFADLLHTLEADLQRLDDVFNGPLDDTVPDVAENEGQPVIETLDGRLRLAGRLEMRAVTFGFRHNKAPLIEDFSLAIEPGQRVAVVGPSGSGKSTLVLLASGLYQPWHGEVLFDGRRRDEIPRRILSASVAVVSQQPELFQATVRDNLTLWNPSVPDEHVVAAAIDAAIHADIIARPLGYESRVEEGGRNFSGGQRLRLELARALVTNPSILILDEATSSLDTLNEARVDDALRRRGCACLIVAHRLSTVRDADRIIVLDKGRVVQQGVHDELVAEEGLYRMLVHAY